MAKAGACAPAHNRRQRVTPVRRRAPSPAHAPAARGTTDATPYRRAIVCNCPEGARLTGYGSGALEGAVPYTVPERLPETLRFR
ncbi:hypothetical protein GCM10009787_63080 [Streptomyces bangladeshensis]|uniref:Uncharacterized protein n=1 Tax=Streptomyces bangladeshensis TaxID=295352 RepID=A0ABN3C0S2_9ACTN